MLLSVIILFTDDDCSFLEGAISSIKQGIKFSDYEIIAVDNRIKDKTKIQIENVKIISKGYNLNCFEGRRFGFLNSHGKFIWNFDVDDLMIGELYQEEIKLDKDFIQMYYSYNSPDCTPLHTLHLPRAYGWNVWSRLYSRKLLEKAYSLVKRPVEIFTFEDKVLWDIINTFKPTYAYIERPIYQYNVLNATNTPDHAKKYEKLLRTGMKDYDYVYSLIDQSYKAEELRNKVEWLIAHAK